MKDAKDKFQLSLERETLTYTRTHRHTHTHVRTFTYAVMESNCHRIANCCGPLIRFHLPGLPSLFHTDSVSVPLCLSLHLAVLLFITFSLSLLVVVICELLAINLQIFHLPASMLACVCACVCACVSACVCACVCANVCACMCASVCVCVYRYPHLRLQCFYFCFICINRKRFCGLFCRPLSPCHSPISLPPPLSQKPQLK